MKTMTVANAQTKLNELVSALSEGPVLLLRKGQPCAALVGLSEPFDREAFTLGRNKRLRQLMDEACQRAKKGEGIPFAEILADLDKPQTRARSRSR